MTRGRKAIKSEDPKKDHKRARLRGWYAKNRLTILANHKRNKIRRDAAKKGDRLKYEIDKEWAHLMNVIRSVIALESANYQRDYYLKNKEQILKNCREYYQKNKPHILQRERARQARTPIETRRAWSRNWARRNPEANIAWARNNPEKRREVAKQWARRFRKTVRGAIHHRMSTAIGIALRGGKDGRKWEKLAGYSLSDLRLHLENRFRPGMNWERFVKGEIHIDHVIPKTKFEFESSDDIGFKRCWAMENLQPLWKKPNLSKGNKILVPSQIPLGV